MSDTQRTSNNRLQEIASTIESQPVLGHWPHMRAKDDAELLRNLQARIACLELDLEHANKVATQYSEEAERWFKRHEQLKAGYEPLAAPVVKCTRGGDMTPDDLDKLVNKLCGNVNGNVTDKDVLYRAQVAILHLVKLMRTAPQPNAERIQHMETVLDDAADLLQTAGVLSEGERITAGIQRLIDRGAQQPPAAQDDGAFQKLVKLIAVSAYQAGATGGQPPYPQTTDDLVRKVVDCYKDRTAPPSKSGEPLTYSKACALLARYAVAVQDRHCCGDSFQDELEAALKDCTDAMGVTPPTKEGGR